MPVSLVAVALQFDVNFALTPGSDRFCHYLITEIMKWIIKLHKEVE